MVSKKYHLSFKKKFSYVTWVKGRTHFPDTLYNKRERTGTIRDYLQIIQDSEAKNYIHSIIIQFVQIKCINESLHT